MSERPAASLPLHADEEMETVEAVEPDSPGEGSVLWASVALRYPSFTPDTNRGDRADALGDHIGAIAVMRGALAELRLRANVDLKIAQDEWEILEVSPTGKQTVAQAKTRARPKVAQRIKDAKWTVQRATEEIERMTQDYDNASRAYTILTGS